MKRDITVSDLLWMIRRNILPIIAITLISAAIAAAVFFSGAKPLERYTAKADFQILVPEGCHDTEPVVEVFPEYIDLLSGEQYQQRLQTALGVSDSDAVELYLKRMPNTTTLRVTAESDHPELCAKALEEYTLIVMETEHSFDEFDRIMILGSTEPVLIGSQALPPKAKTAVVALCALMLSVAMFIVIGTLRPIVDFADDARLLLNAPCIGVWSEKRPDAAEDEKTARELCALMPEDGARVVRISAVGAVPTEDIANRLGDACKKQGKSVIIEQGDSKSRKDASATVFIARLHKVSHAELSAAVSESSGNVRVIFIK